MKIKSFTLAEILISLTIIGIIAALTLPALMANLNEKVWNTKRKALHSRMAQALAAMPNLDKYLENEDNSAAFNFINDGLATSFNITKVCENGDEEKCDFGFPQLTMNDDTLDTEGWTIDTTFNTINGESLGVYYNPNCRGESNADFLSSDNVYDDLACAEFIYDLNGASKGPNKYGKDMGTIVAFFPEYPLVVAPMPAAGSASEVSADDVDDLMEAASDYRLPSPAEAVALSYSYGFLSNDYDNAMYIWADNGVRCNSNTCERPNSGAKADSASAYLILMTKNGDAPKTFKTLENENGIECDTSLNLKKCQDGYVNACDKTTGKWVCVPE